jgi:hypothetical protein
MGVTFNDDKKKEQQSNPLEFKDPKEYEGWSQEQKEEETKKMMEKHKQWAEGKLK